MDSKTIQIDEYYSGPLGRLSVGVHTLPAKDAEYLLASFPGPPFNVREAGPADRRPKPKPDETPQSKTKSSSPSEQSSPETITGPPYDCPYCDQYEGPSLRGLTAHVVQKHPERREDLDELKARIPAENAATGPVENK